MELWLSINKNYDVSSLGNVRNSKTMRILKSWTTGIGYRKIQVGPDRERYRVHRLVATAFCSNPNQEMYIDHINHDRADNRCVNLRWVSASENCKNKKK